MSDTREYPRSKGAVDEGLRTIEKTIGEFNINSRRFVSDRFQVFRLIGELSFSEILLD